MIITKDERTLLYADKLGFGDEEFQTINRSDLDVITDAVTQAVLNKLSEHIELPEPIGETTEGVATAGYVDQPDGSSEWSEFKYFRSTLVANQVLEDRMKIYSENLLKLSIVGARLKALEDAVVLMEEQDTQAPKYNAKAIRALKEVPLGASQPKGE